MNLSRHIRGKGTGYAETSQAAVVTVKQQLGFRPREPRALGRVAGECAWTAKDIA